MLIADRERALPRILRRLGGGRDASEARHAVAMAKAYASDMVKQVTSEAIQLHGGIGFTWEHDMHLYHRRALAQEAASAAPRCIARWCRDARVVTAIAVHGGAGREAPEGRAARRVGIARATDAGWAVLARGGAPWTRSSRRWSSSRTTRTSMRGSARSSPTDGVVEMDASVMTGDTLEAGAVGAVSGVLNPVRLARAVLAEGREVLLVGEAAVALARRAGLPPCEPGALVTEEARRRWRAREPAPGETVGAVACDARGRVAAATSTGGIAGKRRGRVGDSAVIGAGTYADDRLGAGSATGPGEAIIRVCLVRDALHLVSGGADAAWAAQHALDELARRLGRRRGPSWSIPRDAWGSRTRPRRCRRRIGPKTRTGR